MLQPLFFISIAVIPIVFLIISIALFYQYRRLGRSQDVCKGPRLLVEGARCVVGTSFLERFEVNEGEEEDGTELPQHRRL